MKPIVLVDDSADHLELMVLALRKMEIEYPVTTFTSGEDCLGAVERGRVKPRLLLMDVNMPGLDGPAAAQRLRALDAMRSVPIVMLSTSEQAIDVLRARDAGVASFVAKPQGERTWLGLMKQLMHYWTEVDLSGRV